MVRESVKVDLLMDGSSSSMGHGGMGMSAQDPIVAELKAVKNAAGRYEGKVSPSATGDRKGRVFADPRGLQATATFALRVGSAGPNWLVLGGFAALILAGSGGVVALVKRSSSPGQATTVQETSKA